MNRRFVALGLACVVVAGAWFVVGFRPAQSRLSETRAEVDSTRQEVAALETRLANLRALAANEGEVRERAEALADALPGDPALSNFIRFVEDAAAQSGIGFLSVAPSLPTAAGNGAGSEAGLAAGSVQAISVGITADGRFFAIEEFVVRMERLRRAVSVESFTLSSGSGEGGAPSLSLQMNLKVFMTMPQPAAGQQSAVAESEL